jgi:hypothetical protein
MYNTINYLIYNYSVTQNIFYPSPALSSQTLGFSSCASSTFFAAEVRGSVRADLLGYFSFSWAKKYIHLRKYCQTL